MHNKTICIKSVHPLAFHIYQSVWTSTNTYLVCVLGRDKLDKPPVTGLEEAAESGYECIVLSVLFEIFAFTFCLSFCICLQS